MSCKNSNDEYVDYTFDNNVSVSIDEPDNYIMNVINDVENDSVENNSVENNSIENADNIQYDQNINIVRNILSVGLFGCQYCNESFSNDSTRIFHEQICTANMLFSDNNDDVNADLNIKPFSDINKTINDVLKNTPTITDILGSVSRHKYIENPMRERSAYFTASSFYDEAINVDSESDEESSNKYATQRKKILVRPNVDTLSRNQVGASRLTFNRNQVGSTFNRPRLSRRNAISIDETNYQFTGTCYCPDCGQQFINQYYLGEHYTYAHQSYNEMRNLDSDDTTITFCGIDMLEIMGMFYVPRSGAEKRKFINGTCDICCEQYTIFNKCCKGLDIDNLNDTHHVQKKSYDDVNNIYNTKKYIKWNDDMYHEKKNSSHMRYPVRTMCCNNSYCDKCIKQIYIEQKKLTCAFCQKNYLELFANNQFIKTIEPTNGHFNADSWTTWWKKNDRTNLLAF